MILPPSLPQMSEKSNNRRIQKPPFGFFFARLHKFVQLSDEAYVGKELGVLNVVRSSVAKDLESAKGRKNVSGLGFFNDSLDQQDETFSS